jgi:hypothetical protein
MSATAVCDGYDVISLADNEWGNEIMREVANEWFASHPDCAFVEVREHAGWWLGYYRSGECVGTANDCAVLRPDRPCPAHGPRSWNNREVIRPYLREVSSLSQYSELVSASGVIA